MGTQTSSLAERASEIALLVLDVDGVLTDGTLLYSGDGEQLKPFNVRDGQGIRLLQHHGIRVAVISARRSAALARRMADLQVEHYYPGTADKSAALDSLLEQLGLDTRRTAYVGDDIIDLPVMRRVGLAVTVRDGHALVKQAAHWVTDAAGGRGAVREVTDMLLEQQGGLARACEAFLAAHAVEGSAR
jgi:3-deoxy-D-manno-octulosonate 8-phosphate phosphatase (KDO 8-P phosphatase)